MTSVQQPKRAGRPPSGRSSYPTTRTHYRFTSKCWQTGKLRYPDQSAAKDALTSIAYRRALASRGSGESRRSECRAYWCPRCHGWHLTSQPLAQDDAVNVPIPEATP